MSVSHGMPSRGLNTAATSGSFGRMFPQLPPRRATGLETALRFGAPGGLMDGGDTTDSQLDPELPAGFTYFGQFVDHDLTLDVMSRFGERTDPSAVTGFRSPRLDLDSLYGAGSVVSGHLYDGSPEGRLALTPSGADLARTPAGVPFIGDPRNDENLILSQFHVAMIKFHNRVTDKLVAGDITDPFGQPLPPRPENEPPTQQPGVPLDQLLDVENYYDTVFAAARRLVQWHYQWIIVHEYLPLIADAKIARDVEENGPRFFKPGGEPFIPVEFAVAAFRFGHPTVRTRYRVNEDFAAPIFPDDPNAPANPRVDLRGGMTVLPEHAVDWRFFFDVSRTSEPQTAKRIEATLNTQLLNLPVSAVPGARQGALAQPVASLAVRNLLRSETLGLPSGQDVARAIGEIPLTDEELGTTGPVYLWYYVLKEAEVLNRGRNLGPVGSRIVAEVLIGLLDADPSSYRSVFPRWRPTLAETPGRFEIADLLYVAGVVGT
ncbi:heme peroxidase family protein [Streptomyces sp. LUP47B]|uniref:peroxidase family protein n=1 Tax=Streptomyces sp. LUP47B TaxID=1890286 RepID=UPI0008518ADF|nr:heme peroxidase family protein [Streptomyces sp. LUP47B]